MKWHEHMYYGPLAVHIKDPQKLLETPEKCVGIYLLTLPSQPENNQLEILPAWQLSFWKGEKEMPPIIGLAVGKKEAMQLTKRLIEDMLSETGEINVREYFSAYYSDHT